MPCIGKRLYLRRRLLARLLAEDDVIVGIGIERRVQVDKIHTCRGYAMPQNVEVITVVEEIVRHAVCLLAHINSSGACMLPRCYAIVNRDAIGFEPAESSSYRAKKRLVKVAMKVISSSRPRIASPAASRAS